MSVDGRLTSRGCDQARWVHSRDGLELFYRVLLGDDDRRPALLLLHGLASNHTRWGELVRNTSLGSRWDLLRPDLRGNGKVMVRGRLSLETWCEDLVEILADGGYPRAVVVGHSLGAQVALRFAWRHPALVAGLGLLDPVVPEALVGKLGRLRRAEPFVRLALPLVRLGNRVGLYRRRIEDRDLGELDREAREVLGSPGGREAFVARYSSPWLGVRHTPLASYLQQLLEMVRPLPPLEEIPPPALVLQSTGLAMHDAARFRACVERLPQVEIRPIDATHWPLTESPDQVRHALEEWLLSPRWS